MVTQQESAVKKHPLAEKELACIQSWSKWRELWKRETRVEIIHSLLHFGFNVRVASVGEEIDRLCLYLEIADSEDGYFSALRSGSHLEERKGLSKKAFQMLCQNVFKDKNVDKIGYQGIPSWLPIVVQPQVPAKLFWFFRLDDYGYILNLFCWNNENHLQMIAKDFVLDFCCLVWDGKPRRDQNIVSEKTKAFFLVWRPDVIALLAELGQLDLLFKCERFTEMDEVCWKKLEALALRYTLWLPGLERFRYVQTSQAADD